MWHPEARFLTCAGVIFNVTRCGRNRWPGELKSPFSDLCWRIGRFNGPIFEPHFPQPRGQNVTPGSTKKLYAFGSAFTVSLQLFYKTHSKPWFWSDKLNKHGLAASQNPISVTVLDVTSWSPFFDLCWGDLQCHTLRPEPMAWRAQKPVFWPVLEDLQCQTLR